MPNHDYRCAECGWVLADQYRSIEEGGSSRLPACFNCDLPMVWVPQAAFDLRTDGSPAVAKFTVRDGRNHLVEIDSLHKLRQVERESEQAARNGEGQPLVFRAYSQHRGNRLDNTFGEIPQPALSTETKRKFGLRGGAKSLTPAPDGAPDIPFGPGVNESNASALKE